MWKLQKRAPALLIALAIPACAGQSTPPLVGTSVQIDKLPRVSNSPKSPCWQQEEIAAQNSYIATVQNGGKEVVYKAPCVVETKQARTRTQ